jgi:hypothetical protein
MRTCHRCGRPWDSEKKTPGVKEICENCSSYLHACLNCRFYEPKLHNQCAIPNTEWVGDKAGANFCDEFEFRDAQAAMKDRGAATSARQTLDSLFGDAGNESKPDALDALKRLFDE